MIKRLDITNVRAFEGEHSAEFAAITLIYGPNSAGKSSLIKTLGLLKQTLGPGVISAQEDRPPLLLEGPIVDFGSFANVVNRHEADKELGFGVQFSEPGDETRTVYAGLKFMTQREARALSRRRPRDAAKLDELSASVAFQTAAELGGGGLSDGGRVRFDRDPFTDRFHLASEGNRALAALMGARVRELQDLGRTTDADAARYMRNQLGERAGDAAPLQFLGKGFFPALPDGRTFDNPQTEKRYGAWFAESMYERALALSDLLEGLAYLGPMRAAPARFEALSRSGERSKEVGATGEHVTRLLADSTNGVLEKVNHWLTNELEIGYRLEVTRVKTGKGLEIGDLYATSLIDDRGTRMTPQDVGFGISQVLPVVVQLLANTNATICIEQPEIHIHPRLQAQFGDLVLESISPANNNQVIIESHSEHLVRRLQRRLRKRGERPEYDWLKPEHIAVNYVSRAAAGAVLKRLPLNDDGDFKKEWPDGFFEETYEEMYG
jgi:hypothetical protein